MSEVFDPSEQIQKKRPSQRQPLACRACTKSKVRCDKNIPCARCSKRNKPCEREAVEISTKSRRKRALDQEAKESKRGRQTHASVPSSHSDEIREDSRHLPQLFHDDAPPNPNATSRPTLSALNSVVAQVPDDVRINFEDLATCIEGLAWGRHQCHRYPHRDCLRFEAPKVVPTRGLLSSDLLNAFPDVPTARRMVDFHLRMLAWNHNVLHVPTFSEQCEKFWSTGSVEDGQWLALYCSVLSASAWSIRNSSRCQGSLNELHAEPSPAHLFELASTVMTREDFMGRHTIFSLQAICISGMVANVLGKSDLLITWVTAGIRIAQCLGLHHVGADTPGEPWNGMLDKEIGRRVWWKLVELDYHSIPYTGTYSINTKHFTTQQPRNCNDNLKDRGETQLSSSTYAIIKARMALLIPSLLDGPSQDVSSRYEHVVDIDRKMRQLVAKIPQEILRDQGDGESALDWLILARRTLAIAAADKIIMIHRSFLLKSFQSPAYLFTRQTCVSAAMTILREHEEISMAGPECPPLWAHSAFCVAAIVVICLELLYCHASMTPARRNHYLTLIRAARARLNVSNHDTMARRGVYLVDAMLNEELYSVSSEGGSDEDTARQKVTQILHRFIQLDRNPPEDVGAMSTSNSGDVLFIGERYDDFDDWFNSHFRQSLG